MSTAPRAPHKSTTKKTKPGKPAAPRLSRTRRPPELEVADWQAALRRQFGREQSFGIKNLGTEPVFSDFVVSNPASHTYYQVTIRGQALGQNVCLSAPPASNNRRAGALRHSSARSCWRLFPRRRGARPACVPLA